MDVVYITLANLVVALHVGYVGFVVVGLLLIVLGLIFGWAWVRNPWFRGLHLLAITIVAVWLIPQIVEFIGGWQWAFSVLAIGPALGIWSMLALRRHPDAIKIANGRR